MTTFPQKLVPALALVLALASYPLSWLPLSWAQDRYGVTVPWALVSVVIALAGWASGGARQWHPPGTRWFIWPVGLLAASLLISVRFSQRPYLSVGALPMWAGNLGVFVLAGSATRQTRRLTLWWVVAAVVVALNGLARLAVEPEFLSTIGNRNFLGAYLAASACLAAGLWPDRKWVSITAVAVFVAGMFFCQSRGAWVGLGGAGVVWAFMATGKRGRLFVLVLAVTGMAAGAWYLTREWQRDVRPVIWQSTLRMIATQPVIGHGLGTFTTEYPQYRLPEYFQRPKAAPVTDHAHNELLEIAAEQGVLGVAAVVWLWGTALWRGWRRAVAGEPAVRPCLAAAIVLFVHGILDVGLRYAPDGPLFWLLLGVLVAGDETTVPAACTMRLPATRWLVAGLAVVVAVWLAVTGIVRPMQADIWERRARLAEARGDLAAATAAVARAIEAQPFRLRARYLLAELLARQNLVDEVITELRRLQQLAPDYANVPFNLRALQALRPPPPP